MISKQQRQDIEDMSDKGLSSAEIAMALDLDWIDVVDEIDRQCQDAMDFVHCIGEDEHVQSHA